MDRIQSRLYLAIGCLITATLALAVFAGTAASGEVRLEYLALAAVAAVLARGCW